MALTDEHIGRDRLAAEWRPSLADRAAELLERERIRWFVWLPVFYGLGIAIYFSLRGEPRLDLALAIAVVAVVAALFGRSGTIATVACSVVVTIALGFAAAKLRSDYVAAPVLPGQMYRAEVEGFVELVEPRSTGGDRLTIAVTALSGQSASERPQRVRIRTRSPVPGLEPGHKVRVLATLSPPAGPAVPGGFDFARTAWFERLGAVGYARSAPEVIASDEPPPFALRLRASVERARQAIGARVRAVLPGETGAIAEALITGERGAISAETTDAFRASGLLHILSISGLHMVVMAGAVFFLVRLGLAAVPALALRYPIKKWAAGAATLAALAYLTISGFQFATVRSAIMISIMYLAVLLDRPALALRNVAIAALVILLLWPESLNDVGFQMSFAAVVALVAVYEEVRQRLARDGPPGAVMRVLLFFGGIVLSTVIAGLAVAPFSAYHFHQSQQYAVLANLAAIPIANLVVMPAALFALVLMPLGLEALPLMVMGAGIDAMVAVAASVAALPGAVGRIPAMPVSAFALMVCGGLWLCLWRQRWRFMGVAGIAAGLALAPTEPRPDLLVGRDGALVAVRGRDGALSALPARQSRFELARWLENDGDGRDPKKAAEGQAFRCDGAGCTALVGGHLVGVSRHPASIAEDCRRVGVLISDQAVPARCTGPRHVIDLFAVRRYGTHAFYVEKDQSLRVATAAELRGVRPWAPEPRRPPPRRDPRAAAPPADPLAAAPAASQTETPAGGRPGPSPALGEATGDQGAAEDDRSVGDDRYQ